ncbi:MAG: PEP-CTERM sorting domain-containing protein [Chthonomonas sp.]|nr:PEP-CTERM sorting domain-containing protein [Chthonomonas sp.]
MNFHKIIVAAACAAPAMGLAQISIYDASYRLEADARSGASFDTHTAFLNNMGPVQGFGQQIDSFANQASSNVHTFASAAWNCSPTTLSLSLVACWVSVDNGAGNSGHMMSRATLGIDVPSVHAVTTMAQFDPPNSFTEIDMLVGTTWVLHVSRTQIQNYSGFWMPGSYRLRSQRLYDRTGNSTGCVPYSFGLTATPVPEPGGLLALGLGGLALLRRKRA